MPAAHTYKQAAKELGLKNERWLRRNIRTLPHTKIGRQVLFSDADLERIRTIFHQEPKTGLLAPSAPATAPQGQPTLATLKPRPRRRRAHAAT